MAKESHKKIIQIDEHLVQSQLKDVVKSTVEETLNNMLDAEADRLCNAERYAHTKDRTDTRAGHYKRKLHTTAGEVELKVPKLRKLPFETAIIERYKRRESSVEESLIEMYLAGVSVRRVEDITEALWGTKVSSGTVSNLNKQIYEKIESWRNRPLKGYFPYVYLDGIVLKRSWGGEIKNISVLVAVGVSESGYREIIGVAEGAKEDKSGWSNFLTYLKSRGLHNVKLFITDKCMGLVESIAEHFPDSKWQRCIVHFYRNVFSVVPRGKVREIAVMLKAIHAQENREEALKKAHSVSEKLKAMKLKKASEKVKESIHETLEYMYFPEQHWRRIRTNNPLERIMREIRRRTRVVGNFPDGNSALMLVAARLRHIAGTNWGSK
ncbi:MAG: IS256 family transposase, partial [Candidatus Korarchaeota archaeon]|nr:IS256 family transposase [Candidatus Korarchaeota archaeon]